MSKVRRDISQVKKVNMSPLLETKRIRERAFAKVIEPGVNTPKAKEAYDNDYYLVVDSDDLIEMTDDQYLVADDNIIGFQDPDHLR